MKLIKFFVLSLLAIPAQSQNSRLTVFMDDSVPQLAFAAGEIGGTKLPLGRFASARCSPCIVLASGPAQSAALAKQVKAAPLASAKPQSYGIRRVSQAGRDVIAVLASDAAGAMYGALDIAEAIRLGTLDQLRASDHSPHIENRGIKFNVPLDARTPSYSDNSDSAQNNIPEMWSADFWHEFLDEMARYRYNVLSLWNLHPFPSMVKVPEYPDVALADVKRTKTRMDDSYSFTGNDMVRPELLANVETVRSMSIEDKIRFWRDMMQYASDRGIQVYVFTWNIFTYGAEGKYGITPDQTNQKTIDYFRASVRELVLTYPLLAGIGITAGEQMREIKGEFSKEKWLSKTYGEGVRDALKSNPSRQVRLIHRYHQTGQGEILDAFRDYPGPFDLSFKYSIAHMYSIPNPPFIRDLLPNLPEGKRTWLTVRNDDVYSFRWGDAGYAREYIRNMPGPTKIAGYYMGPDGYTWGREFLSKQPDSPRQLVISKQWYSFLLWGRLGYDPDLPDSLFQRMLARRFPETNSPKLMQAWSDASQVFPLITRFFWGDIDLRWFPEACLSHPRYRGFYTVRHFMEGEAMPGSGVLNIRDWRRKEIAGGAMDGIMPLQIADQLEKRANGALAALPSLRSGAPGKELRLTLEDIEAMSRLAQYYAEKIRAAAALALYDHSSASAKKQEAIQHLEAAVEHWRQYAQAYTAQYTQPHLYNRVGFVDIPGLTAKTLQDVEIAKSWIPGTIQDEKVKGNSADKPFNK
jgi:hypothetical protein